MRVDEATLKALCAKFQTSHESEISQVSFHLGTILLQQEAVKISSDDSRTNLVRNKIRASLAFADMDSRRSQIYKAKGETYDWILGGDRQNSVALGGLLEWLDDPCPATRMFWISGKPGSGKSTLLRYLDMNVDAFKCCRWLSQKTLFICGFFVWSPGEALQKSFRGLLQAVLHQLLSTFRWLTEIAIGDEKLYAAESADASLVWTVPELEKALVDCLSRVSTTTKILMLLDGLDELQGNDQDRQDMLEYLRSLSQLGDVKLCVSSRSWNIFNDFFADFQQSRSKTSRDQI